MLGFFEEEDSPQKSPEDAYCAACRQLGDNDCQNCDRKIEVIDV